MAAAAAALAGCAAEEERDELPPGSVATIGVVSAPGPREALVPRGVQVAAAAINSAGGIGGAARVELVVGPVARLLGRDVRLLVLPCDARAAREAALTVAEAGAVATAPCDDGTLPQRPEVLATGLSPALQAEALIAHVDGRARVLPASSARGRRVQNVLERLLDGRGEAVASPEAPERVLPPPAPDGTLFATYGYPEPGSEVDEFYERFRAVFAARPTSIVAALASDALTALAAAIELAGSTEAPDVARVFREEGFEVGGVLGPIVFPAGRPRAEVPVVVLRLERGRFRVVAELR